MENLINFNGIGLTILYLSIFVGIAFFIKRATRNKKE